MRLILLAASSLALASCGKKSDSAAAAPNPMDRIQPVEVMPIQEMTLTETVELVGSIAANESAELRSEIPGTLTEISFEEGARVKQGDPLAKLDTRELEAQLAEARARFALAAGNLERNVALLRSNAISQAEVDVARAEEAQLQAAIDLLEVRLAKSTITAPFDGITSARTLSIGDYVTSQSIITTLDDLSRLKVEIEVPERYLPKLQPGTTFTLRTATLPAGETITGEVYFVSSRIDDQTRATQVKGYVLDPPPFIKPGMFANVSLVLRTVENAMVVPETAVLNTERGSVLIFPVEKDGVIVAEFIPVRTGLRVPGYVQVSPVGPPIKVGDKIVSAGVGGLILFPGVKLKPVEPLVQPGAPPNTDRRIE
ncbi:MAG: efflux RND transporter periplasmic adaptor subunit [Akkermansiaceae bacterium]